VIYIIVTAYMLVCPSVTLFLFSESLVLDLCFLVVLAASWYQVIHYPKGICFLLQQFIKLSFIPLFKTSSFWFLLPAFSTNGNEYSERNDSPWTSCALDELHRDYKHSFWAMVTTVWVMYLDILAFSVYPTCILGNP